MRRSATARFVNRNELTLFLSLWNNRQNTTPRFPNNAMTPSIQIAYFKILFLRSSSQLEMPAPWSEVHDTAGRDFSAKQHCVKSSTLLKKCKRTFVLVKLNSLYFVCWPSLSMNNQTNSLTVVSVIPDFQTNSPELFQIGFWRDL